MPGFPEQGCNVIPGILFVIEREKKTKRGRREGREEEVGTIKRKRGWGRRQKEGGRRRQEGAKGELKK